LPPPKITNWIPESGMWCSESMATSHFVFNYTQS
jgi:hypothetical protein